MSEHHAGTLTVASHAGGKPSSCWPHVERPYVAGYVYYAPPMVTPAVGSTPEGKVVRHGQFAVAEDTSGSERSSAVACARGAYDKDAGVKFMAACDTVVRRACVRRAP